jgi:hypothetical protein
VITYDYISSTTFGRMEGGRYMLVSDHLSDMEEKDKVIDLCYKEFCGRDLMHLPLDEAIRTEMREFCQLAGIFWHEIKTETNPDSDGWMWSTCSCGDKWFDRSVDKRHWNIDLLNPLVVLGIMRKRKDFYEFMVKSGIGIGYKSYNWIGCDYLINPDGSPEMSGKLFHAANNFMKERKKS